MVVGCWTNGYFAPHRIKDEINIKLIKHLVQKQLNHIPGGTFVQASERLGSTILFGLESD